MRGVFHRNLRLWIRNIENSGIINKNLQPILKDKLTRYENPKNSNNSSIPPFKDENRPFKSKSLRKKTGRTPGGQKGHEETTLEMVSKSKPNISFPRWNSSSKWGGLSGIFPSKIDSNLSLFVIGCYSVNSLCNNFKNCLFGQPQKPKNSTVHFRLFVWIAKMQHHLQYYNQTIFTQIIKNQSSLYFLNRTINFIRC